MSTRYLEAARRLGRLLELVEKSLAYSNQTKSVGIHEIEAELSERSASYDEIKLALIGLEDLGVVNRTSGDNFEIDHAILKSTAEFRRGVAAALGMERASKSKVELCVTFPSSLSLDKQADIRRTALDLRTAVVDVIASAQQRVILAAPFWDSDTVSDISQVVERRLKSGVQLTILGRFNASSSKTLLARLEQLAHYPGCRVLTWNTPDTADRFGISTFHFKAAVSDYGRSAYLGSANFTVAGMRSRFEAGTILRGPIAQRLSMLMEIVLQQGSDFLGDQYRGEKS
ncbi:hypothetical protein B4O97_04035 [Marispirochaeta aestuarii]|uniref:Phospholipase D-like domain-containing protein n=1 Tax=Marispirochaeta aestuarii TaxID=1963862 RepID=A0A1Y1S1J5_9SPIO|nr:phospholipase D-like domain-containing protein [Marispirochaeta aestuarii]ORC37369.1 hypothetical protein B4O97_04035 [Marispirochaeta aestuarii]